MAGESSKELHAELAVRFPGVLIQSGPGQLQPHWHLYHAANSICAQKVRATLAATGQPYVSHALNLFGGDSYDPTYVRVRMQGCRSAGLSLVRDHSGSTSVTGCGCDPCVVPTVVDERSGEVIVDSHRICFELDARNPIAPRALVPEELRPEIEVELAIIDDLPNYQLLVPALGKPSADAPENAFALDKVARCERLLRGHGDDHVLRMAYTAKRAKEQMAAERLFTKHAIEGARARFVETFAALDQRLRAHAGPYRFGSRLTIADLFWAVELVRALDVGSSGIWKHGALARLSAYYDALCRLPAIRDAVLEWPGARLKRRQ